ncbi:3-octaprenyl-4-hydroxybenzoate carboxy-lyase [Fusarium napiforme]|uniref:3-octaprenyl-4-hydroxybenzoate carboxy-lyase n=1 Tax=Fusarium napiforme TaxID=42672 RepID=A0A8H5NJL0_9HYPO|nr:3-octaprenyl-4-hydroxybenzoate carboxy-lyase [Fusarium napiforme]
MSVTLLPAEAPKSPAENFRRYIQELHNDDDLLLVEKEVDPDLELAAICRRVYKKEDKAPLFMNVKGSSSGGLLRVLSAPMWLDKGDDMPFALCFGVPPAAIMVSGMPILKGVNEAGYVGALTGNPVEVIECETNDIYAPTRAEIVYEGFVSTTEATPKGPMAEHHGHIFPGESHDCPLFRVNAITHRTDPILPVCVAGRAPEENHTVWGLMQAAETLTICQDAGLPITMAWNPFESHCL